MKSLSFFNNNGLGVMNSMVLKGFFTTPPNSINVLVSDLQLHILMKARRSNTKYELTITTQPSVLCFCLGGMYCFRYQTSSGYISPYNNYLYPFLPPALSSQSTSPTKSSNLSCPKKKLSSKKKKGSLTVGDLTWSPTLNGTLIFIADLLIKFVCSSKNNLLIQLNT